jgi:hypothetical protein
MFQAIGALILAIMAAVAVLIGGITLKLLRMMFKPAGQQAPANGDQRLDAARRRFDEELAAVQQQRKTQAKRKKGNAAVISLASVGAGIMTFGLAMQFDLFPLIGIGGGILVAAAVAWIANAIAEQQGQGSPTPSGGLPRLAIETPQAQTQGLPSGRAELVQRVLGEAGEALRQLDGLIGKLRHPDSVAHVAQIVASGNRLMKAVADKPEQLNTAQRVFTYYCPQAVKVAEGLVVLETARQPDSERIIATQSVLKKLAALFDRTEIELGQGNAEALDIDVRLLAQSLEAELKGN